MHDPRTFRPIAGAYPRACPHEMVPRGERRVNAQLLITRLDEYPPLETMKNIRGLWVELGWYSGNTRNEIHAFLSQHGAMFLESWAFLPFVPYPHSQEGGEEYELCRPGVRLEEFGRHVNGSTASTGVPAGLRIRTAVGARLADYIGSAYQGVLGRESRKTTLDSESSLGGASILTTTLLQMNDKLPLVNHVTEELERSETLNLFSLAAMHLALVDDRKDTDIARLVATRRLIVRDVRLGV